MDNIFSDNIFNCSVIDLDLTELYQQCPLGEHWVYTDEQSKYIELNIELEFDQNNEKILIPYKRLIKFNNLYISTNEILEKISDLVRKDQTPLLYIPPSQNSSEMFITLEQDIKLDCSNYLVNDTVKLLIKNKNQPKDTEKSSTSVLSQGSTQDHSQRIKREKERTIGFAMQKVDEWKQKQKQGFKDQGQNLTINLDQAALLIKLSRKTLDDYQKQIKLGKELHFDFNSNMNQGIGKLRRFNKKKLEEAKATKQMFTKSQTDLELSQLTTSAQETEQSTY